MGQGLSLFFTLREMWVHVNAYIAPKVFNSPGNSSVVLHVFTEQRLKKPSPWVNELITATLLNSW